MILRKTLATFILGFMWLFVFSIPVDREHRLFDLGYVHLVNTKPMHWVIGKIRGYFDMAADNKLESTKLPVRFSSMGDDDSFIE